MYSWQDFRVLVLEQERILFQEGALAITEALQAVDIFLDRKPRIALHLLGLALGLGRTHQGRGRGGINRQLVLRRRRRRWWRYLGARRENR